MLEGEVLGPETEAERELRERLNFLAWLLDSSIPIPGTRFSVGLDAVIGLFPFIGDLFDAVWKANVKNVQLLNAWAERPHQTQHASRLFLAVLTLALIAFFAACGFLTYLLVRWLIS